MLDDRFSTEGSVFILPFSLQQGEAEVVGRRIEEELRKNSKGTGERNTVDPEYSVDGQWDVEIAFHAGTVQHEVTLDGDSKSLSGTHRTEFLENDIRGAGEGRMVRLVSEHRYEGTHLVYTFEGEVTDD